MKRNFANEIPRCIPLPIPDFHFPASSYASLFRSKPGHIQWGLLSEKRA